jgi:ATP-dependent 26S proteasome regulatory subunit
VRSLLYVLVPVRSISLQRLKVLRPLSEPDTFCTTLWRPVKGVLFYGPPGTGTAAQAVNYNAT